MEYSKEKLEELSIADILAMMDVFWGTIVYNDNSDIDISAEHESYDILKEEYERRKNNIFIF